MGKTSGTEMQCTLFSFQFASFTAVATPVVTTVVTAVVTAGVTAVAKRQRIAKRQNHAESTRDHRRAGSGGRADEMSLGDAWPEGRSQSNGSPAMRRRSRSRGRSDDRSEGRRGRSRSVVRDGISKIRSASLKPFKSKKGDNIGKSWDNEGESVGSGGTGRSSGPSRR